MLFKYRWVSRFINAICSIIFIEKSISSILFPYTASVYNKKKKQNKGLKYQMPSIISIKKLKNEDSFLRRKKKTDIE